MNPDLLPVEIAGAVCLGIVVGYDCAGRLRASRLVLGASYLAASALLLAGTCLAFSGRLGADVSMLALMLGAALYHAIRNSSGDRQ